MQVILRKDIEKLGAAGDMIEVSNGYGRNYLLPRGLAIEATPRNIKTIEHEKRLIAERKKSEIRDAEEIKKKISDISVTIAMQAGEEDKLFGAVTTMDIAEALSKDGISIDKRNILLEEPIKRLGIYNVNVKVHPEVMTELKVWVVKG
ncbi:MAG: 50S ribosomal protein L9 [Nitrospirae bacterium]|nr:50S ribosomal protein L9 [Nitrospirota bacterium]